MHRITRVSCRLSPASPSADQAINQPDIYQGITKRPRESPMETLRARRPDAAIGSFNGLSSHMGRILAIDYGRKRTGLAVTDPLQIIANTVPTHTLMDYVKSYAAANAVDAIVIGMPLQMDGLPSESYTYIRPFVEKLRKEMPAMRIELFDERFTSRLALRAMIDGGVPKKRRREDKGLVDRISATIILQGYLDSRDNHLTNK